MILKVNQHATEFYYTTPGTKVQILRFEQNGKWDCTIEIIEGVHNGITLNFSTKYLLDYSKIFEEL